MTDTHEPTHSEPTGYAAKLPAENPATVPAADTAKAKSKSTGSLGLVAVLAVGALVGGAAGAGVATWAITSNVNTQSTANAPSVPATITVNDAANATQITAIAASAGPSVVTVSVNGGSAAGTGSGVILTEDGFILTNTHVVTLDGESAHPTISVQSYDGHVYTAKLIGTDPITDLAVIKIEGTFQPLQFADSSKLNVGDDAIAIGAPLGLSNTVTSGIVSALNRSITVASSAAPQDGGSGTPNDSNGSSPFNFWEFSAPDNNSEPQQTPTAAQQATIFLPVVQTDAAINPGNSGGALLDIDGKIIGINVAIAGTRSTVEGQSGNIGVGFAIPANLAKRVAFDIINDGVATHGLLGATVMDALTDSAITTKTVVGASVQSVTNGGAAEKAGIRKGDIVTGFNSLPITSSTDLTAQVRAAEAGSNATVTFVRNGQATTVTVTLGTLK